MKKAQWALFKDGAQVSKSHSTCDAVAVEAFERGLVVTDCRLNVLATQCEIRDVGQAAGG